MPDLATYIAFLAAVLVMQITPGPDMALVIGRGVGQGHPIAFCTVLGFMAAGLIQVPLLVLGRGRLAPARLAARFRPDALARRSLSDLARGQAAVLIPAREWPGAAKGGRAVAHAGRRARGADQQPHQPQAAPVHVRLPAAVRLARPGSVATQLLVLGLTQKATGLVVQGSVALASGAVGGWLARKPGFLVWQERFTGLVMVGLGLRLLLADDGRPART